MIHVERKTVGMPPQRIRSNAADLVDLGENLADAARGQDGSAPAGSARSTTRYLDALAGGVSWSGNWSSSPTGAGAVGGAATSSMQHGGPVSTTGAGLWTTGLGSGSATRMHVGSGEERPGRRQQPGNRRVAPLLGY